MLHWHFSHPLCLWALPLAVVFYWWCRRPQTVVRPVGSLELWKQEAMPTGASTHRYPHWPLFLLQVLAYSLLVLACASPMLLTQRQEIVLVIDTSASMATREQHRTILAHCTEQLQTWLHGLEPQHRITLYTYPPHQKYDCSVGTLPAILEHLQPSQLAADWPAFFASLRQLHADVPLWWVTDGAGSARLKIAGVHTIGHGCLDTDNASIDAMQIDTLDSGGYRLFVALRNFSGQTQTLPLVVQADGLLIHNKTILLTAGERRTLSLPVPTASCLQVEIARADNFALDNRAQAVYVPPARMWIAPDMPIYLQRLADILPGVVHASSKQDADVIVSPLAEPAEQHGWIAHTPDFALSSVHYDKPQPVAQMVPAADALWRAVYPELLSVGHGAHLHQPFPADMQPLLQTAQGNLLAYGKSWLYCGFATTATNWPQLPSFPIFWCNLVDHLLPQRDRFCYVSTQALHPEAGMHRNSQGHRVAVNFFAGEESDNQGQMFADTPSPQASSVFAETPVMPWLLIVLVMPLAYLWRRL